MVLSCLQILLLTRVSGANVPRPVLPLLALSGPYLRLILASGKDQATLSTAELYAKELQT